VRARLLRRTNEPRTIIDPSMGKQGRGNAYESGGRGIQKKGGRGSGKGGRGKGRGAHGGNHAAAATHGGSGKGKGKQGAGKPGATVWDTTHKPLAEGATAPIGVIDALVVDDDTKGQIGALFNLLDANRDGKLSIDDLEALVAQAQPAVATVAKNKALVLFTKLQEELDFDSDGVITPREFVLGMIKLAIKQPVSSMLRTVPSPTDSIAYTVKRLEIAANNAIKENCKRLATWMHACLAA